MLSDWVMGDLQLEERLATLEAAGVELIDRRQIWVGPEVKLERIRPGVVLHPGTRLRGKRTYLAPKAEVGTEGPATVVDSVFGERATVASGFVSGAVLLRDANLGANAHVRPGTLLEEEACTAHAVGLKQTILMAFVTLGSLINFCDCLMCGGTSRRDHSEVGSGYIHFNFTPWGERGDKATPSLVGDVPRGVFLGENRIFLGGSGGLVGPAKVGFGTIVGAGQVLRRDVGENRLILTTGKDFDRELSRRHIDAVEPRASKNIAYIAQLLALRAWYQEVRLTRAVDSERPVLEAAVEVIDSAVTERRNQLDRFLQERNHPTISLTAAGAPPCPLKLEARKLNDPEHIQWVKELPEAQKELGKCWLEGLVNHFICQAGPRSCD